MESVKISELAFADDVILIAKTEKDLNYNLKIWDEQLKKNSLNINLPKTKSMLISRTGKSSNTKIDNTKIKQILIFKYLGAWINEEGRIEEEVTNRIASAGKCFHSIKTTLINRKEISKRTKVVVYKTICRPIQTYSCEL
jgi:hypothetical protein